MKKKMMILASSVFLAMMSQIATAVEWSNWNETNPDKIVWIYPQNAGLVVLLENTFRSRYASSCSGQRKFIIERNSPNYEIKAQTILEAFMSTRSFKIEVSYDKENSGCYAPVRHFILVKG